MEEYLGGTPGQPLSEPRCMHCLCLFSTVSMVAHPDYLQVAYTEWPISKSSLLPDFALCDGIDSVCSNQCALDPQVCVHLACSSTIAPPSDSDFQMSGGRRRCLAIVHNVQNLILGDVQSPLSQTIWSARIHCIYPAFSSLDMIASHDTFVESSWIAYRLP